jgi:hypothetical protein
LITLTLSPFLFREIWRSTGQSPCHEEGSRSHSGSQEGPEKRDQEAGADSKGSENAGQIAVEEQNAEQKRREIPQEKVKKNIVCSNCLVGNKYTTFKIISYLNAYLHTGYQIVQPFEN